MYEANKPIKLKYITKDGEEKSIDYTPEKDMNRPQIIMMLQSQDKNFFKLMEGEYKMGKNYIKLESVYRKPKKITESTINDANYIVLQDSSVGNSDAGWMDVLTFNKTLTKEDFDRMKSIIAEVKENKPDTFNVTDLIDAIKKEFPVDDHMEVSNSRAMYIYY